MATKEKKQQPVMDFTKKISIRQYCDPEVRNLGLENYNLSLFSGANGEGGIRESLGYRQIGNKRTYLTGLNIDAEYLSELPEEQRSVKELELQEVITYLEKFLGAGTLDSANEDFWKSQELDLRRPVVELDLSDTKDLITYYCILGGGYAEVAPSFTSAKESNRIYKFYLHEDKEVSDNKVAFTKAKNKASVVLETLDNEDPEKMFRIAKILLPIERGYTSKTPSTQIYQDLSDYIQGYYTKHDIKAAPKVFMEIAKADRAFVNVKALVREALHHRFIVRNEDQMFSNPQTLAIYGRNEVEILAYLSNPIHSDELNIMMSKINSIWNY